MAFADHLALSERKEYYDYMLSYSPYDNVRAQPYPAMLVTTSERKGDSG